MIAKTVPILFSFLITGIFLPASRSARAEIGFKGVGSSPHLTSVAYSVNDPLASRHTSRRHHHRRHFVSKNSFNYRLYYNRVDGFLFHFRYDVSRYRSLGSGVAIQTMLAYGTESKRIQYEFGLERGFFGKRFRFAPGFEIYDETFSEDEWIISAGFENSLAAFFLHEDFMDFYRLQGYGGYIKQNFFRALKVKAGYYEEHHSSLQRRTDWALLGGHKTFRENPPIQDGSFRGLKGQLIFDTRDSRRAPERGWYLQALAEYFPDDFTSDFHYQRYILDLRRYQPISDGEVLRFRLRLGDSRGDLPVQKWFSFGGISTLRGYRYKSFRGTRMALANLEYFLNWDEINWKPDIPLLDAFNLILFADAGTAWNRSEKEFADLTYRDFASDVGIALANSDGRIRLNFAKRTDRGFNAMRITFRLRQPF
ncbi:MAG: BamA/TamA family outer membrane protein [Calditrichaeota bacterium]|nr:BamA/TamA family outer membrane protein [Calditrichota bacterium]